MDEPEGNECLRESQLLLAPVFAVWIMDCKWACRGSSILNLTFVCSKVWSVLSLGLTFVIQMDLDHHGYFVGTEFLENTSRYCRGQWQSSNSIAPLTKRCDIHSAEVTCNWTSATGIIVFYLGLFKWLELHCQSSSILIHYEVVVYSPDFQLAKTSVSMSEKNSTEPWASYCWSGCA